MVNVTGIVIGCGVICCGIGFCSGFKMFFIFFKLRILLLLVILIQDQVGNYLVGTIEIGSQSHYVIKPLIYLHFWQ